MATTQNKKAAPDTTQESSFIFSLAELSRMEDERLRAQAEAEIRTQRAAAALAAEEAARVEAAERQRQRALDEVERARAAEIREASARHAAMVEAARVKAEVSARAEAEEKRRAEEHQLEKLRLETAARSKRRVGIGALVGAVIVLAGAIGVQFGVVQPANAARLADARSEVDRRGCEIDALKGQLEAQGRKQADVSGELAQANATAAKLAEENAGLKKQLEKASQPHAPLGPVVSGVPFTGPTPPKPPVETIPAGFHRCSAEQAARTQDPFCWTR